MKLSANFVIAGILGAKGHVTTKKSRSVILA